MSELGCTSELATLIEAQLGICDEMIALAEREQQALSRFRPAQLPELLAAQDDCAARLTKTQEALDATVRAAADGIGLVSEDGRGRTSMPCCLTCPSRRGLAWRRCGAPSRRGPTPLPC